MENIKPMKEASFQNLVSMLEGMVDFRINRHKQYPIGEILFLTLSAVMSGYTEWEEIQDFGEEKIDWLRKYYPYSNGIPSHDTINRVISNMDNRHFEKLFIEWATKDIVLPQGTVINVDGKKVRGSATKKEQQAPRENGGKSAIHLVDAWCGELGCCLGQYRTEDKSNEITAIPALLELLDISGCTVTIDAMGCQKAIARQIVGQGANYVFGLKDNQIKLREAVSGLFGSAAVINKAEQQGLQKHLYEEAQKSGHGRIEKRVCRALPASLLDETLQREWVSIRSIVEVTAYRMVEQTQQFSIESRYYISSLETDAQLLNRLIRSHWGVENSLHWSLDVSFREDHSRKRSKNAAANFGTILRLALNNLKQIPEKRSIHRKQNKCAMSDEYREKAMGF